MNCKFMNTSNALQYIRDDGLAQPTRRLNPLMLVMMGKKVTGGAWCPSSHPHRLSILEQCEERQGWG